MASDFGCGYCGKKFSDKDQLQNHYWTCIQSEETKDKIVSEKEMIEAEKAKMIAYRSTPEGLLKTVTELEERVILYSKRYENLLKKNSRLESKIGKLERESGAMKIRSEDLERAMKILMENNVELGHSIQRTSDRSFLFGILGMTLPFK